LFDLPFLHHSGSAVRIGYIGFGGFQLHQFGFQFPHLPIGVKELIEEYIRRFL
jgi:hypothetical protein